MILSTSERKGNKKLTQYVQPALLLHERQCRGFGIARILQVKLMPDYFTKTRFASFSLYALESFFRLILVWNSHVDLFVTSGPNNVDCTRWDKPSPPISASAANLRSRCHCYSINQLWFVFSEQVCGPWPCNDNNLSFQTGKVPDWIIGFRRSDTHFLVVTERMKEIM